MDKNQDLLYDLLGANVSSHKEIKTATYALLDHARKDNANLKCIWHPLGFISIKLAQQHSSNVKFHIWYPLFRRPQSRELKIHNHDFDLTSHVLYGSVTNIAYDVTRGMVYTPYRLYKAVIEEKASYLYATTEYALYELRESQQINVGETYKVPKGAFHSTVVPEKELAITVVRTENKSDIAPRIIGSSNGKDSYRYQRNLLVAEDSSLIVTKVLSALSA